MALAAQLVSLVAVAASLIACEGSKRGPVRPYAAEMKSDLRRLVSAQEEYFSVHNRYSTTLEPLTFASAMDVTVRLVHADSGSFAAEATYRGTALTCNVSVGAWTGAPADSLDGVATCITPAP